jgi:hypothetical protein
MLAVVVVEVKSEPFYNLITGNFLYTKWLQKGPQLNNSTTLGYDTVK